jgi:hypothetical protein
MKADAILCVMALPDPMEIAGEENPAFRKET